MPQTALETKRHFSGQQSNIIVVEPHYQRVNHFSPKGKLVLPGASAEQTSDITLAASGCSPFLIGKFFISVTARWNGSMFSLLRANGAVSSHVLNVFGQPGQGAGGCQSVPRGFDVRCTVESYVARGYMQPPHPIFRAIGSCFAPIKAGSGQEI